MAVADRAAQPAECAVTGDERGQCVIGAFDHPDVAVVGQLGGSAGDIVDEGRQRAGQLMLGPLGEEARSSRLRPVSIADNRFAAETVQTRSAVCAAYADSRS